MCVYLERNGLGEGERGNCRERERERRGKWKGGERKIETDRVIEVLLEICYTFAPDKDGYPC